MCRQKKAMLKIQRKRNSGNKATKIRGRIALLSFLFVVLSCIWKEWVTVKVLNSYKNGYINRYGGINWY